ncbi:MAG: hypothetical protein HYR51_13080 [Candidatus Rokubacteria bacterium]|nr:hypothetical protein [Candidatus Rokubacteria bacterium]
MAQRLTDWLQQSRLTVVAVDTEHRRVRLKDVADACSDVACGEATVVLTEDGAGDLSCLNPGDIVRVEGAASAPRIVIVRRIWDELTSPEF